MYPQLPIEMLDVIFDDLYQPQKKISIDSDINKNTAYLAITQPNSGNIALHNLNYTRAMNSADRNHGATYSEISNITPALSPSLLRADHNYDARFDAVYSYGKTVTAIIGATNISNSSIGSSGNPTRTDVPSFSNSFFTVTDNVKFTTLYPAIIPGTCLLNGPDNKVIDIDDKYLFSILIKNNFQNTNNSQGLNNEYINRLSIVPMVGDIIDFAPNSNPQTNINLQANPLVISEIFINNIKDTTLIYNIGLHKINLNSALIQGPLPLGSAAQNNPVPEITSLTFIAQQYAKKYILNSSNPSLVIDANGKINIFYDYQGNISCAVSSDKGNTWYIYYDLIPILSGETALEPNVVMNSAKNRFYIYFKLNNLFVCRYEFDIGCFNFNDAFIRSGLSNIDPKSNDDLLQSQFFSNDGNRLRQQQIIVILGGANQGISGDSLLLKFQQQTIDKKSNNIDYTRVIFDKNTYIKENIMLLNYYVYIDLRGMHYLIYNLGQGFDHVKAINSDGSQNNILRYQNILGGLTKYYNDIGNSHNIYHGLTNQFNSNINIFYGFQQVGNYPNDTIMTPQPTSVVSVYHNYNTYFSSLINNYNVQVLIVKEADNSNEINLLYGQRKIKYSDLQNLNNINPDTKITLTNHSTNYSQYLLRRVVNFPLWFRYNPVPSTIPLINAQMNYSNIYYNSNQFSSQNNSSQNIFPSYTGCSWITSSGSYKSYTVANNQGLTSFLINGDMQVFIFSILIDKCLKFLYNKFIILNGDFLYKEKMNHNFKTRYVNNTPEAQEEFLLFLSDNEATTLREIYYKEINLKMENLIKENKIEKAKEAKKRIITETINLHTIMPVEGTIVPTKNEINKELIEQIFNDKPTKPKKMRF